MKEGRRTPGGLATEIGWLAEDKAVDTLMAATIDHRVEEGGCGWEGRCGIS